MNIEHYTTRNNKILLKIQIY